MCGIEPPTLNSQLSTLMTWLALDIGGANLKAANGLKYARSVPFPLWRTPERLPEALRSLLASGPPFEQLAVTMTGELADCFPSKADGVRTGRGLSLTAGSASRPSQVAAGQGGGGSTPKQDSAANPACKASGR